MATFIWDTKSSTGIDKIDAQHKQLFNLINKLNQIVATDGEHQSRIRALNKIVAYIYYHIDAEESFMRQNGYIEPLFLEHQIKHQEFIKKIAKEQLRCMADPERISNELLNYLMDWLIGHILSVDRQTALAVTGAEQSIGETSADYSIKNTFDNVLKESESRFKELVDNLPAFIWLKDPFNRHIYSNKYWQQITGLTIQECAADTDAWLNCIHQDDRDRLLAEYARVFTERSTLQIEYRLLAHDGSCLSVLETAAPRILENNEFAGFIGWGMNISRQKQVEAALVLSVEQLEEAVKKGTQELRQTDGMLAREKEAQQALNQKLKETQNHLIQSGKTAAIGQLAAGIAHEINNPLDSIYSNLNILKQYLQHVNRITSMTERLARQLPYDNAEVMAFNTLKKRLGPTSLIDDLNGLVKASIEAANQVQKLVRNLCDFSRTDKTNRELFNIEEGIDAVLTIINSELKYKAEIIKDYGGIRPIHCIGSQLNQVFMNLLINAAHAIEDFGKITVRTGYKDADWLWVEIEDTGAGIPDPIKSKIFDPFFTTKPADKVLGLGLSLSYKIIQDHQGELAVDSTVGEGTRFRLYLPVN